MLMAQPKYPSLPVAFPDTRSDMTGAAPSSDQLVDTAKRFLKAFGSNDTSPLTLLTYFSSTQPVSIQHCPAVCTNPGGSLLCGANAVRSYFDLIATHWKRSNLTVHSIQPSDGSDARRGGSNAVVISASIIWTWRQSGRGWTENFRCMLVFDEQGKIQNFTIKTQGEPGTCVMRAVDVAGEGPSHTPGLQGRSMSLLRDRSQA